MAFVTLQSSCNQQASFVAHQDVLYAHGKLYSHILVLSLFELYRICISRISSLSLSVRKMHRSFSSHFPGFQAFEALFLRSEKRDKIGL